MYSSEPEDGRFTFEVPEKYAKAERVDKVLAANFSERSRSQIQKAIDSGLVFRDDSVLSKKSKVSAGDLLNVAWIPDVALNVEPANIPLDVVFEDEHMIAVSKPVGMVTHPGVATGNDTLVHALLHHTSGSLCQIGAPERPGIVHRLDKETTGLIVVAKSDRAYYGLVEQFSERSMKKCYRALVLGAPVDGSGSVKAPIGRHPVHRTRMAVVSHGKFAHTDWELLNAYTGSAALVDCRIHTGRTHQIRVHMQHLGYPLLGDAHYGFRDSKLKGISVPRGMLHAHTLELNHPVSKQRMELKAELPADFRSLMCELEGLA